MKTTKIIAKGNGFEREFDSVKNAKKFYSAKLQIGKSVYVKALGFINLLYS